MASKSRFAKSGLRVGTLGAFNNLAIAFPLLEGSANPNAHTDASRIGWYASRTVGDEKIGIVIMGTERWAATADGAEVNGSLLVSGIAILAGPLYVDSDIVVGTGVLLTTATSGFVHISGMDGTPTGVPNFYPGRVPLTYDRVADTLWAYDTMWIAVAGSGATGSTYLNAAPTPTTLGGIPAGSTFPTAQSMQQMWDKFLYPYQAPSFSAFQLNGPASVVEVGFTIGVNVTFTWGTSNSTNVVTNSISIVDNTLSLTLGASLANDGSESFVLGAPIQKVTATSHSWTITGQNSQLAFFNRGFSVSWRWKLYFGINASPTLSEAQIEAMSGSLGSGYAGTYSFGVTGYKYISFAHAAGGQINSAKDQSTGFNVPFATAADNAAYSNIDGGGFSYALVSVTNANGVTTNYRVYRTTNILGGAVVIVVT